MGVMHVHELAGRFGPYYDDMVSFAQRLIQTPSMPGEEQQVAELVAGEMARLGYDDVRTDAAGSVLGLVRGATATRCMMLNAHMDHVSVGDEKAWAHAPFSGEVVAGEMWGRGAVDLKGSLACQVYALGALRRERMTPPWDVYVAAAVLEERGGLGTEVALRSIHPQFCVIGEATGNQLALGHRGGFGMYIEIMGRAAHASMVDVGINPHYSAARFILGLRGLSHVNDDMLGPSTAAPTLYTTDQTSGNVIPGLVRIYLDWRSVPGETTQTIMAQVDGLLQASLEPGVRGRVLPRRFDNRTYTGMDWQSPIAMIPVKTDPGSELARRSQRALEGALGRRVERIVWRFCTDGSICAEAGVPIVGFGPGDQELAHTSFERVALAQLREAMVGDAALALSPALASG